MPAAEVQGGHVQSNLEHLDEPGFRAVQTPAIGAPCNIQTERFHLARQAIAMPNRVAAAVAVGVIIDGVAGEAAHFTQQLTDPVTDVSRPANVYEAALVVGQIMPRTFRQNVQAGCFRRARAGVANGVGEVAADLIGPYPSGPGAI